MSIYPSIPELILAIFAALLSLAVSLFLVKIQNANSKSVKNIEEEQKILISKQSEAIDIIHSKLVTSRESQDASDFLEKDAITLLDEIYEKMLVLKSLKKKTTNVLIFGIALAILSIGTTIYLFFSIINNGGKVYLSELMIGAGINIFSLIYFWFASFLQKKYMKDFSLVKSRLVYVSGEILRAVDISHKGVGES